MTPLEIVRTAVREPSEVLERAGVPAVVRDAFDEQAWPDDRYGLVPRTLGDLGDADLGPLAARVGSREDEGAAGPRRRLTSALQRARRADVLLAEAQHHLADPVRVDRERGEHDLVDARVPVGREHPGLDGLQVPAHRHIDLVARPAGVRQRAAPTARRTRPRCRGGG